MQITGETVRHALERVPRTDEYALEFVDPRVLEALERRTEVLFARERARGLTGIDAESSVSVLYRSTLLTYACLSELARNTVLLRGPDPFDGPVPEMLVGSGAVGLIEHRPSGSNPVFGVSFKVPTSGRYPLWGRPREIAVDVDAVFPGLNLSLPVVIYASSQVLHGPPHPRHTTATCYAVDENRMGIIVAGHSVAKSVRGASIPMTARPASKLIRSGYQPVDAAFLETSIPPYATDLAVVDYPTTGDEVVIRTRSGDESRTVVQVNNSIVSPNFREYPVVLYLDRGCKRGDSGALVQLARTGEAVGIYTGTHKAADPNVATPLGTAQNFAQAIYALGVTPKL